MQATQGPRVARSVSLHLLRRRLRFSGQPLPTLDRYAAGHSYALAGSEKRGPQLTINQPCSRLFKPSCRRAFPRPRHQTAMPNNGRPEYRAIVTHRKESRLIRKAELCLSRTFRLPSETTAASLAASDPIRILTWLETETQEQEGYCLTSERKRNNRGLAGMRGARSNF